MTDFLESATGLGQHGLQIAYVVFLRIGAVMALLPAFGEQSVPQRVRLGLALCFTAVVAPAVSDQIRQGPLTIETLFLYSWTEVLAGLSLGLGLRLFILSLQMAGSIAAQATSLSQIFGGAGIEPQPAIGQIMMVSGLALATMSGLHVRAAEVLILSYEFLPAGKFPDPATLSGWGLERVAHSFSLAFSLAAPFVLASLIYNIAMGVINRAMPQLMVAMVGAPAITAGSLVLMALVLPFLLSLWLQAFHFFLGAPFGVVK